MVLDGPSRRDIRFGPFCSDCKPTYNHGRFFDPPLPEWFSRLPLMA
jgi:hypothetical protein